MEQKAHFEGRERERLLPNKLFYKIGEVSRLTGVEPYVLRYWESEFPFLRPRKSKSGQRIYVRKDLETILKIKNLLYDERYTIEGVRKKFSETRPVLQPVKPKAKRFSSPEDALRYVKKRLSEILSNLT